jgi:chromate transport protein ChrA
MGRKRRGTDFRSLNRPGNFYFIQALFKGLGAIVTAIVLNPLINYGKPIIKDGKRILIAAFSF